MSGRPGRGSQAIAILLSQRLIGAKTFQ